MFILFIVPAIGWFIGYILRSAFGAFSGGWAFFIAFILGIFCIPIFSPMLVIPTAIGFFFGLKGNN